MNISLVFGVDRLAAYRLDQQKQKPSAVQRRDCLLYTSNPMKAVVFEGQSHIPNLLYAELISWWKPLKKSNKLMALF